MQKITLLFIFILASLSLAQKTKKEVEIPINIGVGPALFWIPGVVDRELHTGAQLKFYGVLTPKLLQENQNKIPKQYKKYVNLEEEMHVFPIWMMLIPEYLVISPGEDNSIYGAFWPIVGVSMSFVKTERIKLKALFMPTISYIYAYGDDDPDTQHIVGAGLLLKLENTIKFSDNFLITLAYGHDFAIKLNERLLHSITKDHFFQTGVLSMLLNFRFGMTQKI
ncbi:MAG: hypothetical protein FWB90_07455 [Fibromonadales bacterium]|nr:hypothetical protein [Fibromonadales bacterium]